MPHGPPPPIHRGFRFATRTSHLSPSGRAKYTQEVQGCVQAGTPIQSIISALFRTVGSVEGAIDLITRLNGRMQPQTKTVASIPGATPRGPSIGQTAAPRPPSRTQHVECCRSRWASHHPSTELCISRRAIRLSCAAAACFRLCFTTETVRSTRHDLTISQLSTRSFIRCAKLCIPGVDSSPTPSPSQRQFIDPERAYEGENRHQNPKSQLPRRSFIAWA